ncbi:RNA uridylyltransferase [Aureococcus anophagefferens]|nr:RNA uridylyltransferase [Aureococcus anophagefferens]
MDVLDDISQEEIDAFAASGQDLGPGEDSIFVAAFAEAFDHDPNVAACRPCKPAPPLMFRSPTLVYLPQKAEAEFDALAGAYSANLAPNLAPSEGRWPSDGADASGYIAGFDVPAPPAPAEDAPTPPADAPDALAPSIAARLASSDAVEAALVSVCGFAARVADAIVRGDRPEASSSSSDDDGDGDAPIPDWVRAADLDDQLVRFNAWVRGDGALRSGDDGPAADLGARLALAVQEAHPYALAEVYGSRGGVELFDSDVDLRLLDAVPLADVARAIDGAAWSRSVEHVHARPPPRASTGATGLADVSRACDGDRAAADRGDAGDGTAAIEAFASARAAYAPVCRFAKVLLRQSGLDDVYGGGLGSFRCCALVAKALPNKPPGAALLGVLDAWASPRAYDAPLSFGGSAVDLSSLDDPRALAACFARAAAAIRSGGLAAALDVPGLARRRRKHDRRTTPASCRFFCDAWPGRRFVPTKWWSSWSLTRTTPVSPSTIKPPKNWSKFSCVE